MKLMKLAPLRTVTVTLAAALAGMGALDSANAAPLTPPKLPELLRADGMFCAQASASQPHLCSFVMRITPIHAQQVWVSYVSYVQAKKGLPDFKLRVGHTATLEGEELCIQPNRASLKIELFVARNGGVDVRPDEQYMKSLVEERVKRLKLDDNLSKSCHGLTRSDHLLTFGSEPTPMRFVPWNDAIHLRLLPQPGGL
ncbi:MAG: hypothetical protein QM740_21385 [Acidovorax sp.]